MNYPNLKELIKNHDCSIETFASHANVTVDVLKAAFEGKEELSMSELYGIARLTGFPYNALICPKLILMDNKRWKHRMLIRKENEKLRSIIKAASDGNAKAIQFVKCHCWNYEDGTSSIWTRFMNGEPISYALYFCTSQEKDNCLEDMENEKLGSSPVRKLKEATITSEERTTKKNKYLTMFLKSVDELQQFTAAHGKRGMLWELFKNLSCLIGECMMDSKNMRAEDES